MTRLTSRGRTVGYISERRVNGKNVVLDINQRVVGYYDDSGTWDANWYRVADSPLPGLLLSEST
jgi:hypothetical protein